MDYWWWANVELVQLCFLVNLRSAANGFAFDRHAHGHVDQLNVFALFDRYGFPEHLYWDPDESASALRTASATELG